VICRATVATRAGVHLRCTLPHGHNGGCDPYASPAAMTVEDLLRAASYVLLGQGELGRDLSRELEARAAIFAGFRRMAENDRRRGLVLPLAWVNRLDGVPDPTAEAVGWAVPTVTS
jgi:hypothetical protein